MSQEVLCAEIDRLLQAQGLRPRDLERIGVALGPGSFTGIRVGLAAARGMALGAGTPLAGIPSHEALAWPWRGREETCVLLTGLRRGEVFLEAGRWDGDRWEACLAGESRSLLDAVGALRRLAARGAVLYLGEAVEAVLELHPEAAAWGRRVDDPLAAARRPAVVACLAARVDAPLVRGEAIDRLQPLYLRAADARLPAGGGPPGGRT
jgi:tRNA threonylcarbamoyladenosine biosynthesis protein TsaB